MNHSRHTQAYFISIMLFVLFVSFIPGSPAQGKMELPAPLSAGDPPWRDAQQSGGIIYVLFNSPARIKRYLISDETWLPDITLTSTPTAFAVSADALYVANGKHINKYNLDGTGLSTLITTENDILSLHVVNRFLIINCFNAINSSYGNFISVDLTDGTIIDNKSFIYYEMSGTSIASNMRRLFGHRFINSEEIVTIPFDSQGVFGQPFDNVANWYGYFGGTRTWVSPDEKLVYSNQGNIYNATDLSYHNSLGGSLDDLAFYGDLPVISRGRTLVAFSNKFIETGRINTINTSWRIFISGDFIYTLSEAQSPQVEKIDIHTFQPAVPGIPINPNGLNYLPDKVILGKNEIVYLLSKQYQSIFRWSVDQRRYLDSIPLLDVPDMIAYTADENRLYVAYPQGRLYQINLDESLLEKPFVNLPTIPCGLATAGNFVYACENPLNTWTRHSVFTSTGEKTSMVNAYNDIYIMGSIWNNVNRKLYISFYNGVCSVDIDITGVIGSYCSYGVSNVNPQPTAVKADGTLITLSSGNIYNAVSFQSVKSLGTQISDAGWKGDTLVTLRANNNGSELQKWQPGSYTLEKSQLVFGAPLNLFPVQEGWLVITNVWGKTRFTIWSDDLKQIHPPHASFSAVPLTGEAPLNVQFQNLSTGKYDNLFWEFGDGTTSNEINPVHTYKKPGEYSVYLTVYGEWGSNKVARLNYIRAITHIYLPFLEAILN